MSYPVTRLTHPPTIDGQWDKRPWEGIPALRVDRCMGDRPAHIPDTRAKLAYDADALYVIFRVQDRYVRAVARQHQDCVCTDSCVEFFFSPGTDVTKGYFNLEMNCGGIMWFHFQTLPRQDNRPLDPVLLQRLHIAHSLPSRVEPELAEPTTWTVEYSLPFDVLCPYLPVVRTTSGTVWRANFFKCADHTSHPHWLTWARVDRPRPDFHVPEAFDELRFE